MCQFYSFESIDLREDLICWNALCLVLPERSVAITCVAIFRGVPKNEYFDMIIMRYLHDFHCYVILCEYIVDNPFERDFDMLH